MPRLRDLGFSIGPLPTGRWNAITDVVGVGVGHRTVVYDEPRVARTGITIVQTRPPAEGRDLCHGGLFSFNGNGEMTGSHWLEESGLLNGPIGITNTHQVGLVRDALVEHEIGRDPSMRWCLPVVAETYDGFLNDIAAFHLGGGDVRAAIEDVRTDAPIAEGNVGGGTGMICHGFKGGIGTSSRVVDVADAGTYTVGALVQANYGGRGALRLDGRHVGEAIGADVVPLPGEPGEPGAPTALGIADESSIAGAGSVIVVLATDAPLLADQCKRLARRATVGLARVGGTGADSSGDIFVAFSTANRVPVDAAAPVVVTTLPGNAMSPLFEAAAFAVEEAIWNALCAATTMTGHLGRTAHAIPHDLLVALL